MTQATVSRDLAAIGAVKARGPSGETIYERHAGPQPPQKDPGMETLRRRLESFMTGLDGSLNLTVVRTHPSTAPSVASALDGAALEGVLGTVAGDDTVLVISEAHDGGPKMARHLAQLIKGQ